MSINYRDAKWILAKVEEAREVINSYRGMETLGKRLKYKNNKEVPHLILIMNMMNMVSK